MRVGGAVQRECRKRRPQPICRAERDVITSAGRDPLFKRPSAKSSFVQDMPGSASSIRPMRPLACLLLLTSWGSANAQQPAALIKEVIAPDIYLFRAPSEMDVWT